MGLVLVKVGRNRNSIALEADGRHLMDRCLDISGVIAGIAVVAFTGWNRLDPIVALLVASNIIWTGVGLMRRSVSGLMDSSLPLEDYRKIESIMTEFRNRGIEFHALRTRQAAAQRFISVHILVPGGMTVHDAHHMAEDFEKEICGALGETSVTTHIEPIDDEISMDDISPVR